MGNRSSNPQLQNLFTVKSKDDDRNIIFLIENQTAKQYMLRQFYVDPNTAQNEQAMQHLKSRLNNKQALINQHVVALKTYDISNNSTTPSVQSNTAMRGPAVVSMLYEMPFRDMEQQVLERRAEKMPFQKQQLRSIAGSLIIGLAFLERKGIYHGSLRCSHVYIDQNGIIKAADPFAVQYASNYKTIIQNTQTQGVYLSPIQLQSMKDNRPEQLVLHNPFKSDVFVGGLLLLQIGLLRPMNHLFSRQNGRYESDRIHAQLIEFGNSCGQDMVFIVKTMLQFQEFRRPDWVELESLLSNQKKINESSPVQSNKIVDSPRKQSILSNIPQQPPPPPPHQQINTASSTRSVIRQNPYVLNNNNMAKGQTVHPTGYYDSRHMQQGAQNRETHRSPVPHPNVIDYSRHQASQIVRTNQLYNIPSAGQIPNSPQFSASPKYTAPPKYQPLDSSRHSKPQINFVYNNAPHTPRTGMVISTPTQRSTIINNQNKTSAQNSTIIADNKGAGIQQGNLTKLESMARNAKVLTEASSPKNTAIQTTTSAIDLGQDRYTNPMLFTFFEPSTSTTTVPITQNSGPQKLQVVQTQPNINKQDQVQQNLIKKESLNHLNQSRKNSNSQHGVVTIPKPPPEPIITKTESYIEQLNDKNVQGTVDLKDDGFKIDTNIEAIRQQIKAIQNLAREFGQNLPPLVNKTPQTHSPNPQKKSQLIEFAELPSTSNILPSNSVNVQLEKQHNFSKTTIDSPLVVAQVKVTTNNAVKAETKTSIKDATPVVFSEKSTVLINNNKATVQQPISQTKKLLNLHVKPDFSKTQLNILTPSKVPLKANNSEKAQSLQRIFEKVEEELKLKPSGPIYQGEMKKKFRHGQGRYTFEDGIVYEGRWSFNQMHGEGTLYFPDGRIAYIGQWAHDQMHGRGRLYNRYPRSLDTVFNYSDFTKVGSAWEYYQGWFENDKKSGEGILYLTSGEQHRGCFKGDLPHGPGVFISNGKQTKGEWVWGKLLN